jgi:hypothetical protein
MALIWIILFHFVIYSLPVFLAASFTKENQQYLNYILIGIIFTLTQLFDVLYSIRLTDQFFLNGGDIAYSALLFSSLFLIVSQPNKENVRNLLSFTIIIAVFLAILFNIINYLLHSPYAINYLELPPVFLQFSYQSLLLSYFLYSGEIILQLVLMKKILPFFKNQVTLSLIIFCIFFSVLILDGVLYPLGINLLFPGSDYSIKFSILAKIIFGTGFGIILIGYLLLFPKKLDFFMSSKNSLLLLLIPKKWRSLTKRYEEAQKEIHELRTFLPICAKCKKIRDDEGYWQQLEKYLLQHKDITFTHGYCPECFKQITESIE